MQRQLLATLERAHHCAVGPDLGVAISPPTLTSYTGARCLNKNMDIDSVLTLKVLDSMVLIGCVRSMVVDGVDATVDRAP